jgi:hypothetical protein
LFFGQIDREYNIQKEKEENPGDDNGWDDVIDGIVDERKMECAQIPDSWDSRIQERPKLVL